MEADKTKQKVDRIVENNRGFTASNDTTSTLQTPQKSEEAYVKKLVLHFSKHNFLCWTEVIPNECAKWSQPWRVDLIIFRPDTGYIGIEAKKFRMRQGMVVSQTLKQINKYRGCTYFKEKINILLWVAAYDCAEYNEYRLLLESIRILLNGIFGGLGIGWVHDTYDGYTITFGSDKKDNGHNLYLHRYSDGKKMFDVEKTKELINERKLGRQP